MSWGFLKGGGACMDIYLGPAVFGLPEDTIIKLIFCHRAKKIPGNEQKKKKKS